MSERRERSGKQLYEEYAYVLDFMPQGKPGSRAGYRAGPVVQVIGESFFTLLETNARSGITLRTYDRVYVGKKKRDAALEKTSRSNRYLNNKSNLLKGGRGNKSGNFQ